MKPALLKDISAVLRGFHIIASQHSNLPTQRSLGTTRRLDAATRVQLQRDQANQDLEAQELAQEQRLVNDAIKSI